MYTEQRPLLSNVILLLLLLVSCAIVLFSLSTAHASTSDSSQTKIGLSQIVEHSALNIVRQRMIEALKEQGFENGKNLTILYENAHGNLATSIQIATKLTSIPLDVAIAISTPSAQTLLHAAQKQDSHLPIVFTELTSDGLYINPNVFNLGISFFNNSSKPFKSGASVIPVMG